MDEQQQDEAGIPEWVVTFGDMMSLLLTFFVLLFSMSELKQDQSLALMEALRRRFGNADAVLSLLSGSFPSMPSKFNKYTAMGRARRQNTMNGGDKVRAPVGDWPRVASIRPGKESVLGGVVFFEEGSDVLSQQAKEVLDQMVPLLAGKPQKIEVRGHCSPRPLPPNSPYKSHWELAYERARRVADYLISNGIEPERLRISAAGSNELLDTRPFEAARKRNARVEVYLLNEL